MNTPDADSPLNQPDETDAEPWENQEPRSARTHKVSLKDRAVYVTCLRGETNALEEVFINIGRATPEERVAADIIGRLLSTSLTNGAPVTDLIQHLTPHADTPWEAVARALLLELDATPPQP